MRDVQRLRQEAQDQASRWTRWEPLVPADERRLQESLFFLSFCLTVLVSQKVSPGNQWSDTIQTTRTPERRSQAIYLPHSMLIPQMGSGFSRRWLVDSYNSRWFPLFHHKRARPTLGVNYHYARSHPPCSKIGPKYQHFSTPAPLIAPLYYRKINVLEFLAYNSKHPLRWPLVKQVIAPSVKMWVFYLEASIQANSTRGLFGDSVLSNGQVLQAD